MNNTRFATVIHILTLMVDNDELLTSEWIAGSIQINPVIVRKELSVLRKAGFVISHQGKEGGSKLAKNPSEIFLSDLLMSIKSVETLGKKNLHPNPNCSVGKKINQQLDQLYQEIDQELLKVLKNKTLLDFYKGF